MIIDGSCPRPPGVNKHGGTKVGFGGAQGDGKQQYTVNCLHDVVIGIISHYIGVFFFSL